MPNARGHLLGGLAFYLTAGLIPLTKKYLPFATPALALAGLPFCLFGALFPDIDTHSEGRKLLNLIVFVGVAAAFHYKLYAVALLLAPLPLVAKLARHRGITHNPLFVCLVPAFIIYTIKPHISSLPEINPKYYAAYVVGAISHIVLDFIQTGFIRWKNRRFPKKKA
jgi:membrane-bound metal-dependent hydrolase YbcI (DUF457 family)